MKMRTPGDYILLQQPGEPPWPALVCTDDLASSKVAASRPNGYFTLVLLIKAQPEFRYAMSSDMLDYDPCIPDDHKEYQGLQDAHGDVSQSMFSGDSSLEFWRRATEDQRHSTLPTPSPSDTYEFSEEELDEDVEEQRRLLAEFEARMKMTRPTVSPSPPTNKKQARIGSSSPSARQLGDIRDHFQPISKGDEQEANQGHSKRCKIEKAHYRFDERDCIQGDLADSGQMVRFLIGKEREEFLVPMTQIEKRPYFSDPKIGCLHPEGNGRYRMDLPCLGTFDREDFVFIAEFLEEGSFGVRTVDDNNRDLAFAQCVAAWAIADRLGMEDLLNHIAEKAIHTFPWGFAETCAFANIVYKTEDTPLDGHETMKNLLVEYLAANFYTMAHEFGEVFTDRIQRTPELERDVLRKMANNVEERISVDTN